MGRSAYASLEMTEISTSSSDPDVQQKFLGCPSDGINSIPEVTIHCTGL